MSGDFSKVLGLDMYMDLEQLAGKVTALFLVASPVNLLPCTSRDAATA